MDCFDRKLPLFGESRVQGEVYLTCCITNDGVSISYKDNMSGAGFVESNSFFFALSDIRKDYQKKGVDILCKGAELHVFPGGLLSESTHGELAYEINPVSGEKTEVNIFASVSESHIDLIASIEDQKEERRRVIRLANNR